MNPLTALRARQTGEDASVVRRSHEIIADLVHEFDYILSELKTATLSAESELELNAARRAALDADDAVITAAKERAESFHSNLLSLTGSSASTSPAGRSRPSIRTTSRSPPTTTRR
jgi:hypothetical protein